MESLKQYHLVYVGSPYSKYPYGIEHAFRDICSITARLVKAGITAFSPIVASHPLTKDGTLDPLDYKIWMPLNRPIMDVADCLLVVCMAGWDESVGLKAEREIFARRQLPIYYLNPWTMGVENMTA